MLYLLRVKPVLAPRVPSLSRIESDVETLGTGPVGVSTKPATKGQMVYPARAYPLDRGGGFGPQQGPAGISTGIWRDTGVPGSFCSLRRRGKICCWSESLIIPSKMH